MSSHKNDLSIEALENALEEEIQEDLAANNDSRQEMEALIAALVIHRKKKKMSQSQVAQACKVHRNSICRLESFSEMPSLKTVLKYADCIGMRLVLTEK